MNEETEIIKLREEVKILRKKIDEISQEKNKLLCLIGNNAKDLNLRP